MSKKTVRKTSGREKDALIKAGPEKSEIQAELNQDFPGRYKLITAVVLGTMAASAPAVAVYDSDTSTPMFNVTNTDNNIALTGGTQSLQIDLNPDVTRLTSIALSGTGNTWDATGLTAATLTSGGTITATGNITATNGYVKGTSVYVGDIVLSTGSSSELSVSTGITAGGDISAGSNTVTGGTFQVEGQDVANQWTSAGLTATKLTAGSGGVYVSENDTWTTAGLAVSQSITAGSGSSNTVTLSGGNVTATGNITAGSKGTIGFTSSSTDTWTDGTGLTASNVSVGSTGTIKIGDNDANTWTSSLLTAAAVTSTGTLIAGSESSTVTLSEGNVTATGNITADGGNYPVVLNGSDGTLTTGNTVVRTTGLWVTDSLPTPALTTAVTNDGIVIKNTVNNVTTTNSLTSSGLVATSGAFSGNVTVGTGNKQITLDATTGGVTAPLATINGIVIGTDGKISNLTSGLVANDNKEAVTGDAVYEAIAAAKWSAVVQTNGAAAATTVDVSTSGTLGFAAGNNMSVSTKDGVITYATSATPTFDSVTVGSTGNQTTISGGAVTANTVTTGNTSMSTTGVTVTDATNTSTKTTVSSTGVSAADGTNTTTISSTGVVISDGSNTNKLTTEGLTATTGSFSGNVTVGANKDGSAKITLNASDGSVTATSATIGGISIGTDGKISNLTSGTIEANNKEAVTGGAVYSYVSGSYVSKADAGWNIKVGNAEADKIGTDATVSFNAGSTNVSLSYNADTNAVTVDTAKDVTFDTVKANTSIQVGTGENATKITGDTVSAQTLKAGNSTVTTDGLSVKTADGTKTAEVSTAGLSVTDGTNTASYKANGVTVGSDGANALTTDGLTASAAKIAGNVSVGDQITLAADTGTITATNAKFGNLTFNTTGVEIAGGPSLTSNGIDAANLTIRNVKAGELSATSTEAVNGSQLYATNQAVEANTNSITALRGDTTRLKNRINRVGAQSAALAALQPLPFAEGQNVSVSIGAGAYRGAAAGALGIYYRPTENMMLSLGGSVTAGDVMGNVGFSYRFGTSGLTTEKPQTMAAKISSLSKENADLTAQLTAARTRLESQETRLLKLEALVEKLSAGK